MSRYTLVAGINVAAPRQNYELVMQHEELAAKLRAETDDFERMLDMRRQLSRLGYRFVSLLPVAAGREVSLRDQQSSPSMARANKEDI